MFVGDSCKSAGEEASCLDLGCTWSGEACTKHKDCSVAKNQEVCKKISETECLWNGETCLFNGYKDRYSECSSAKHREVCDALISDKGRFTNTVKCSWNEAHHQCVPYGDCKQATASNDCERISGCTWDKDSSSCLFHSWTDKSKSHEIMSKAGCTKLGYHWFEGSGCYDDFKCAYAKTDSDCAKSSSCIWESEKKYCSSANEVNACGFFAEKTCMAKSNCRWDDRSKSCAPSSKLSVDVFKSLSSKEMSQIDAILSKHGIAKEQLQLFAQSTCNLFNDRDGCHKNNANCIWDRDRNRCTDKQSTFCYQASAYACNALQHCIWDASAKNCLLKDQPCEYVREEGICKAPSFINRCSWDTHFSFCREKKK